MDRRSLTTQTVEATLKTMQDFRAETRLNFDIETLEQRQMLAGEVFVEHSLSSEGLVDVEIKGTRLSDDRISMFVEHGEAEGGHSVELVIQGLDDLFGPGVTTVNGGAEVRIDLSETGLGNVKFNMKSGEDFVEIDLSAEGFDPSGQSNLELGDFSTPIQGDVQFKTGFGDDTVIVYYADILGDVSFRTGQGDDSMTMLKTTVEGSTSIKSGVGDDFVVTVLSSFHGDVDIRSGLHDDTLAFISTYFGGEGGSVLDISMGQGEDLVAFVGVPEFVFDGDFGFDIGFDIPPFVVIEAPTFADQVIINTKIGDDTVVVGNVVEIDSLKLNLGTHDDLLILPEESSPVGDLEVVSIEVIVETSLPELELIDETVEFLGDFSGRGGDIERLFECFFIFEEVVV